MVIMSVDVGEARTGIAVCDKNETLASPVCVIEEYNAVRRVQKVAQKALELSAECVVVGLPKNMNGSEGEKALVCRAFADELREILGDKIPVDLCDERATTIHLLKYSRCQGAKTQKNRRRCRRSYNFRRLFVNAKKQCN